MVPIEISSPYSYSTLIHTRGLSCTVWPQYTKRQTDRAMAIGRLCYRIGCLIILDTTQYNSIYLSWLQTRNHSFTNLSTALPNSIYRDFWTNTHLRARPAENVFCLFLLYTLLLVPVASVFVVLVFRILSQAVSVLPKLFLNSVRKFNHTCSAKLAHIWLPGALVRTKLWFCAR